ncbi:MAG: Secretion system C-terminal sorting domain [Bacteroidota bacterium]|jgi:hypothetical protein|nr:Secretion system C-terminal sorting domain [Bacteroidota bacterium]
MRKILFLVLLLASSRSCAQDWQTIKYGRKDFFKLDTFEYHQVNFTEGWNHVGIKIDSAAVVGGGDSLFYNFESICDTSAFSSGHCMAIKGPSWIGGVMRKSPSNENIFYNKSQEPIVFKPLASVGMQWNLFVYLNNSFLKATVDSVKYEIVNSTLDSVKHISIQFIDSTGNPASHIFTDRSFCLSKKHGIVDWYNMYEFPYDTVKYFLTSSHLLTNFDVYNYNVGDQFGYTFTYGYPSGSSGWALKTILNKYLSPTNDSVYYEYQYKSVYRFVNYCCGIPFMDSIVSINIQNESHNNLNSLVFNVMPREAMAVVGLTGLLSANYNLYQGDTTIYGGLEYYVENNGDYLIYDSCYSSPFEIDLGRPVYVEGCGSFVMTRINTNGPPHYNDHCNLIYIQKGSWSWNHSPDVYGLGIEIKAVDERWSVFPNPARTLINIVFHEERALRKLNIHDVSGRIIESINAAPYGESFQVNIEDLQSGIYFFEMDGAYKKVIITE